LTEAPTPLVQVNPAIPQELNNIVLRAMVKSPDGRFQTADEFRAAIRSLQPAKVEPTASRFAPVAVPAPAPAQAAAPAAVPAPAMPPPITPSVAAANKGRRSLWIGLGAAAAIVAMIAAATVLPRMISTHASPKTPAPVTDSSSPAPSSGGAATGAANSPAAQPATTTDTNPLSSTTPANTSPATTPGDQPPVTQPVNAPAPRPRSTSSPKADAAAQVPAPPPGPSKQEIAQARERMIQLGAEADSVRAGVQQMRGQQQAQGLEMRGDVLASLNRMNSYMGEAERALNENDVETAQSEMDRAEKEIGTLKTFLGR
jgi:eukaryotic-like serine/threonine-protein kinase